MFFFGNGNILKAPIIEIEITPYPSPLHSPLHSAVHTKHRTVILDFLWFVEILSAACFWQLTLVCQWLQTNAMVYCTGTDRESPSYKWSLCDVTGHNKKSLLDGFVYFCMFFLFHRENCVKCIGPWTKMFPILKRTFVFCISVIRWLWLPAVLLPFNLSNHLISGHY